MNVFATDQQAISEAHQRLSVQLPARLFSPLKMSAPVEDDDIPRQEKPVDNYVPGWARKRGVWDV